MTRKRDFNVMAYGASADGTTDCVAAIGRAFADAADYSGRRKIIFPDGGLYRLASQITIDGLEDIDIECDGATVMQTARVNNGGILWFNECNGIRWLGGKFAGADTQADLVTLLGTLGTAPYFPGLSRDYVQYSSAVFKVYDCDNFTIDNLTITGKERLCELVNSRNVVIKENFGTGILLGTLEPQKDPITGVDDKHVVLWNYWIQDYGTQQLKVEGNRVTRHAGLYVGGGSANYNNSLDKLQPRHISICHNHGWELEDNFIYADGCFICNIEGNQAWNYNGHMCKMHGDDYTFKNNVGRDGASGFQFSGKGQETVTDDAYGAGANGLIAEGNVFRNLRLAGVLLQDDDDTYPRGVRIRNNQFLSTGMGAVQALGDHPYSDDNFGGDNALPIRLLCNCNDIEFTGNVIDQSAGSAIISSVDAGTIDPAYSGKVAFLMPYIYHRLGKRCYIKVEGHSVTAYNTMDSYTHYVLDVIQASGTGATLRWVVVSTAYTTDGTGGVWRINRPPYAVTTQATNTAYDDPTGYQFKINGNTFRNVIRCVRLTNVADGDFSDNVCESVGGRNVIGVIPSMFSCERVLTSRFEKNRMIPRGERVIHVPSTAVAFNGNYIADDSGENRNYGVVDAADFTPEVMPADSSRCIAWWSTRFDASMRRAATDHAWGDMPEESGDLLTDGAKIATWIDQISGIRLNQVIDDRRPLYKTSQLNGLPGLQFDGSNDFLRAIGTFANDAIGTLYILAKPTQTSGSNTLRALFSNQNEGTATPEMVFFHNFVSSGDNRYRIYRNEGTVNLIPSASGHANSTAKLIRFSTSGSASAIAVSNGSGAMSNLTLTGTNDGSWFAACDTATVCRHSFTVGAKTNTYQRTSSSPFTPTWAGLANTFFQGLIFEIAYFSEVEPAALSVIEDDYFFARYGSI